MKIVFDDEKELRKVSHVLGLKRICPDELGLAGFLGCVSLGHQQCIDCWEDVLRNSSISNLDS